MRTAVIRRATNRDIEPVRAVLADSFLPTYTPLIGREAADALHHRWHSATALRGQVADADGVFLVAESETELIGHAYASEVGPSILVVFRLYVVRRQQGRGIGSALLERLHAEAPSLRVVRLDVLVGNDPALSFYERRGFREICRDQADGLVSLRMERVVPG